MKAANSPMNGGEEAKEAKLINRADYKKEQQQKRKFLQILKAQQPIPKD